MAKIDFFAHDIGKSRWFEIDNMIDLQKADSLFSNIKLSDKKAFILDIDGTIMIGQEPISTAIDWINSNSNKYEFYYLTNNTSKTPAEYVSKLTSIGVVVNEEHIITPLGSLSEHIREANYSSVYLVANKSVLNYMKKIHPKVSFSYNFSNNQAIILTYDTEINYKKIKNISLLLNNKNIDYVATHQDIFCPTPKGGIPDIGSFITLIESVTGKVPYTYFGKPDKNLIKPLLKKYRTDELVVSGDRVYTDKELADRADIDFICVLSGETKRIDLAVNDVGKYPSLVVEKFGLFEEFV